MISADEEIEEVAWAILQALHENVPEDKRPMSWSDLKGDQDQRIRSAAVAAIECIRARDIRAVGAGAAGLHQLLPAGLCPSGQKSAA
jgi:hypothetical protein